VENVFILFFGCCLADFFSFFFIIIIIICLCCVSASFFSSLVATTSILTYTLAAASHNTSLLSPSSLSFCSIRSISSNSLDSGCHTMLAVSTTRSTLLITLSTWSTVPPLDSSAAATVDLHTSVQNFRSSASIPTRSEEEEDFVVDLFDFVIFVVVVLPRPLPPTPVVKVVSNIISDGRSIVPTRSKKYKR